MADMTPSSISDGVIAAIQAAYPDHPVSGEGTAIGSEPGKFYVSMAATTQVKQLGQRFRRNSTVEVAYTAASGAADCYAVAHQLSLVLRDVTTPQGDLLHCGSCEWTVQEHTLHVFVSYPHLVQVLCRAEDMKTINIM